MERCPYDAGTKDPKKYEELEKTKNSITDSRTRRSEELFELSEERPESRAIVRRIRRYLPNLASFRGVAMAAAALDPHKVAPLVCASVFFAIEVRVASLNQNLTNLGACFQQSDAGGSKKDAKNPF